jgi:hypothetical protein
VTGALPAGPFVGRGKPDDPRPTDLLSRTLLLLATSLLLAGNAFAEKFEGYIWDKAENALLVEGIPVVLMENARVERKGQKGITFQDLRIGWEVEVEGGLGEKVFVANKIKVKRKRYDDTDIEGFIEVDAGAVEVDGKPVVWPEGQTPPHLRSGMRLEGKGTLLDDGTIQIKEASIQPGGFDENEAKYMTLVSGEVTQMKEKLPRVDDPQLQAYVARMGASLVPSWVDPNQMSFNFSVIADPSLNAFALPDGTVVIHTGLLAALENEAQFATVIGHEIAHATHRHGYRGYQHQSKMKWLQLGAVAGGIFAGTKTDSAWAGLLTGVGSSLTISAVVNGHGRDLEDDADRIGLHYMVDAGYDYSEAPEVWRVFNKYTQDQGSIQNFFFSDHSTHRARISNLTQEINANYRSRIDSATLKTNDEQYQRETAKLKAAAPQQKGIGGGTR